MVKICSQNISETSRCGLARPIKVDFKIGGLHSFEWLSRSSNKSLNTYTSGEFEGQVYTTNTLLFFLNHSWTFIPYLYIRANNPAEKGLSVVTSVGRSRTWCPRWHAFFSSSSLLPSVSSFSKQSTSSGHLLPLLCVKFYSSWAHRWSFQWCAPARAPWLLSSHADPCMTPVYYQNQRQPFDHLE